MKILIIAATKKEIQYLNDSTKNAVELLITGIGAPITTFKLSEITNNNKYDLIINIGIAGSFDKKINIGELVYVQQEIFADLGFEDHNSFIPLSKTAFKEKQVISFNNPNKFISLEKI